MCNVMRFKSRWLVAAIIALVALSLAVQPVFAEEDPPPDPLPEEGQVVVTAQVAGPSEDSSGDSGLDGYIGGPPGEYAILSSILSWRFDILGREIVKGAGKVEIYGASYAKAWSSLYGNYYLAETTYSNPCWAYPSSPCERWTGEYLGNHWYWSNTAETIVTWSNMNTSWASATAFHQF